MKKCYSFCAIFSVIFTLLFASCNNLIIEENHSSESDTVYGSLTVNGSEASARSLVVGDITYARVSVTGDDITNAITSDYVDSVGGKGNVSISKVPVGVNRIVTVQAFDKDKQLIEGAVVSAVVDVKAGENSCTVTQETTALANVCTKLKVLGKSLRSVDVDAFKNCIDTDTSWALVDTDKIASDYVNGSLSEKKTDYIKAAGTVQITSAVSDSYRIQITDPSSEVRDLYASTKMLDSAPGTWKILVLDGSSVVASDTIKVVSGQTTTVTVGKVSGGVESGKIIAHVPSSYGYTYAYYWGGDVAAANWPGVSMSKNGDNYDITLEGTKTNIIFNNGGDSNKTNDLYVTEGEWTYSGANTETDSSTTANFTAVENDSSESAIKITVENPYNPDDLSDKIRVHGKYKYIYVWNTGTSIDKTANAMTAESGGWYVYTIDATSASIIFRNAGGDDWSGKTSDLSREAAGEYWFYNNGWYDGNPEDETAPVLSSFTASASGTVSGSVQLSVSASDNSSLSKIVFTLDDSTVIGSVTASGTSATVNYTWETAYVANGKHSVTALAYDSANNASESKSLSFTTKNENLPPVAVISGAASVVAESVKEYSASSSYDQNGGTIASYTWSVSGGAVISSGAGTDKISVTMPSSKTTVTVSLTVKDNEGASASAEKEVRVLDKSERSGDFRDESIYFLMTTRFYDGDSSNNEYCWDEGGEYLKFGDDVKDCAWRGDFKGLAQKLDYIKALGFSAIWITPVVQNASGIDYHGYHAYDFSKVDPRYESKDFTYQDLIDACHAKGIKVIQDIVLNHTGNFGEKNLFHMFDKDTAPYENADVPTSTNIPRSPFMKVAKDGEKYNQLMTGLSMAGGSDYDTAAGEIQYAARINAMKEDSIDTDLIYHHTKTIDWNSENCQLGQMAGDCVDLNTENPTVFKYLTDCYNKYIDMGVDAFRIDTVKHISRYTFNKEFIPAFMERGGESFYIFGETCARYRGRWNEGVPALSPAFYTWKETVSLPWSQSDSSINSASASSHFETYKSSFEHPSWASGIANHLLNGNDYHTPDWSMRSYLDQIDFPMHWAFNSAVDAFNTAVGTNDPDFNDATWNVTYVDSHDYAPDNAPESQRFNGYWPDKLNLIFTFRGIPCIYYGSEIEFKKGCAIDPANTRTSLENSGRAYFGDHLEGTVTASDYGVYTASGTVAETLNHELAQHIRRLNLIRRSITALRKGQYSTQGCSGNIAFKRRYTDSSVDSFALVAINGQATFSGIPSGDYIEVITGKTLSSSGSLTTDSIGEGNMRVYVLKTSSCEVSGKIGEDGAYLK